MEEELHSCNVHFLSISVLVVLGISLSFIGRKVLKWVSRLVPFLKMCAPHVKIHLHREVGELRRATLQITNDWKAVKNLIRTVRDQQRNFVLGLDSDFQCISNTLRNNLEESLAEKCCRNDQHFVEINEMLDGFTVDMRHLKEIMKQRNELLEQERERQQKVMKKADDWTQTDAGTTKRHREGYWKQTIQTDKSIIVIIKKALIEFLKEAQKNFDCEREKMLENMKNIFAQLAEDRENIKYTIRIAFLDATKQTQKTFDHFGHIGRNAMNCMAVLNDNSDKKASTRFQEFSEKLRDISKPMRVIDINVSSIKDTLDNIDNQFDEIWDKLEFGCQSNSDQCEEIAEKLKATTDQWTTKYSVLEKTSSQLEENVEKIKNMLSHLSDEIISQTPGRSGQNLQPYPVKDILLDKACLVGQTLSSIG